MSPKDNFAQAMKDLLDSNAAGKENDTQVDATTEVAAQESTVTAPTPVTPPERKIIPSDEVTIIAPGTKIIGDINTDGGLQVGGEIKGNIFVAATLELSGKIIGDIEAEDITVSNSAIRGNVTARNSITMDKETVIVGDVVANNVEIDGKIKGNLTVADRAHIEADSILVGNLVSGTVNIEEGAMLKGDISITNTQSQGINVSEPDFDISL